jgi:hypothetical protein
MSSDADKQQRKSDGGTSEGARPAQEGRPLDSELGRFELVSDGLVLAAVERAERHRERERKGVMMSDIAEHLGFVHGSWTTRRLRPQLDALIADGSLARSRRHGVVVWELTAVGRGGLERTRRADEVEELPEAPQHRAWRHARATAGERINGFLAEARTQRTPARMRGSVSLSAFRRLVGVSVRPRTVSASGASPTTPAQT